MARRRFGPFELDLASEELWREGRKLPLRGHPVRILTLLIERPGELVSRSELCERLWGGSLVFDPDGNLNAHVYRLRTALGDRADSPRWIETLPGRGYRFVGEPTPVAPSPGARAPDLRRRWAVGTALVVIATILGVVAGRSAAAPTLLVAPLASQGTEDARLSRVFTEDLRAQIGSTYPRRIAVAGDAAGRPRRPGLRRAYELGGSLRTSGRTVRVAIHMADAGSGIQLWSDVIECDVAHLTAIERKIAQRIGHELGIDAALVEPTAQAAGSASRKRQQIALAELEISRGVGSGEPAAFARAIAAAHEALHADYGSAAAHSALAWAELHRGNLARAERELRLAIALDPHDRLARQRLGVVLARR